MKKLYIVLYCTKNMHRPNIYLTIKTVKDKMKTNNYL